jgi:hypothetical protein
VKQSSSSFDGSLFCKLVKVDNNRLEEGSPKLDIEEGKDAENEDSWDESITP